MPNIAFVVRQQQLMFVGCRYLAYGTSMDYMHAEMHVPYSLTWEVGLFCQQTAACQMIMAGPLPCVDAISRKCML